MTGAAYNVGDESMNLMKIEVARLIESSVEGCKITESNSGTDMDKRDYAVSYERIRTLGFKAQITVQDGLKELLKIIPNMTRDEILRSRNI